jgi:putative ABC transport system permease protein
MRLASIVLRNARRNPVRTGLTVVSVAVAMIAFLFVRSFSANWHSSVEATSSDLLVVRNRIALIFPLPLGYAEKLRAVPGVSAVGYTRMFAGTYIDGRRGFAQFAVDSGFFEVTPEVLLSDQERSAYAADRMGAVVGARLADRFGWKVGDRITLSGGLYGGFWDFNIRGIYRSAGKAFDEQTMLFHWAYLDARMPPAHKHQVGVILVKVADAARSTEVARAIDALFAGSPVQTRTESARQFALQFLSMASSVLRAIEIVALVVLLVLLLILANTLWLSAHERTSEVAMMRALGFSPRKLAALLVGESVLIALAGVAVGLACIGPLHAALAAALPQSVGAFLPELQLDAAMRLWGVAAAVVAAGLAALWPARRAGRLVLVDALRKVD